MFSFFSDVLICLSYISSIWSHVFYPFFVSTVVSSVVVVSTLLVLFFSMNIYCCGEDGEAGAMVFVITWKSAFVQVKTFLFFNLAMVHSTHHLGEARLAEEWGHQKLHSAVCPEAKQSEQTAF